MSNCQSYWIINFNYFLFLFAKRTILHSSRQNGCKCTAKFNEPALYSSSSSLQIQNDSILTVPVGLLFAYSNIKRVGSYYEFTAVFD